MPKLSQRAPGNGFDSHRIVAPGNFLAFRQWRLQVICVLTFVACCSPEAMGVMPESPDVRRLIDAGLKYLESHNDSRLGGKCLVALAFLKDGASSKHPRIQEAVESCQNTTGPQARADTVYSNGLAIILLAELDPNKYRDLIERFAGAMFQRQKSHGGWGYEAFNSGDTSQTQYAALSYWELLQIGMAPKVESVEAGTNWLLRTQDPSGAWGYQGREKESGGPDLVAQKKTSLSMLAAGLGSTMIFGNVLGLVGPGGAVADDAAQPQQVPSALRRAKSGKNPRMRSLSGNGVNPVELHEAITRAQQWYQANISKRKISDWPYSCYLLYSLERYKSFEELLTGKVPEEPDWYQFGYEYLNEKQADHGGWRGRSGEPCATAFAVLFLLRSTQKSIKANLGQGTLVGGRGLSADLSRMKLRRGKLVTESKPTEVDQLLGMLEGKASEDLDSLIGDPAALRVDNVGPEEARRLRQIVRSGRPEARLVAVRALSRLRDLDNVPALLYAMTDPDKRVVREADAGLRFVSRRIQGFGLSDSFSSTEQYNVRDRWKRWYRRVRPNAPPLP